MTWYYWQEIMVKASKNKLLNEEFEMKLELNEVLVQSLRYFAEFVEKF